MGTRRRYWVIAGGIAATLLVAGTAVHAPGARAFFRSSAGSVRAVPPQEGEAPKEAYALVDELSGWAGAPAMVKPAGETFEIGGETAGANAPWRRLPAVGNASGTPVLRSPFEMWTEPVSAVHAAPLPGREVPPSKPPLVSVAYGFGSGPAPSSSGSRRSERVVDGEPTAPGSTPIPGVPLPPVVGVGAMPGDSPVPEPTSAGFLAALAAAALSRRRR